MAWAEVAAVVVVVFAAAAAVAGHESPRELVGAYFPGRYLVWTMLLLLVSAYE